MVLEHGRQFPDTGRHELRVGDRGLVWDAGASSGRLRLLCACAASCRWDYPPCIAQIQVRNAERSGEGCSDLGASGPSCCVLCNAVQYSAMLWCGVVWCGVVWCGVV